MLFSRWKYLFRVHFVSPCTSIISTFEYEWPPPVDCTRESYMNTGAYPGGRIPGGGGPSESLILAPWSKVEKCRPHPPPPPSIWRPWSFLPPWSPCLRLNLHGAPLVMLIYHTFLSFSPSFPLFSFFLSFFLSFFFWRLFDDPGGTGPQRPPPRPDKRIAFSKFPIFKRTISNNYLTLLINLFQLLRLVT